MKTNILKIIVSGLICTAIFTSCGINNVHTSNVQNTERNTVEKTVRNYYSSEVSQSNKYLSSYFLNSKQADTTSVKKLLKAFNVKKIEIIKLYNIKKHNNCAIVTCAYNTYFEAIDKPRPDIEIVALINKNGSWYIINDYGQVDDKDLVWLNETSNTVQQQNSSNSELESILKQEDDFNKANKAFIDNSEIALQSMQSSSASGK